VLPPHRLEGADVHRRELRAREEVKEARHRAVELDLEVAPARADPDARERAPRRPALVDVRRELLRAAHGEQVGGVGRRRARVEQALEAPLEVLGRHRIAVRPARAGADAERPRESVRRRRPALRHPGLRRERPRIAHDEAFEERAHDPAFGTVVIAAGSRVAGSKPLTKAQSARGRLAPRPRPSAAATRSAVPVRKKRRRARARTEHASQDSPAPRASTSLDHPSRDEQALASGSNHGSPPEGEA
jgi:hypothetical protein